LIAARIPGAMKIKSAIPRTIANGGFDLVCASS
jgi:hypothetical protein